MGRRRGNSDKRKNERRQVVKMVYEDGRAKKIPAGVEFEEN